MASIYVAALVENLLREHANPVLGLATGSTPLRLYRQLVEFHRQGLSFAHVTTVNLDEYVGLAAEDPHSYAAFMRRELFAQVDIPLGNIFLPNGMTQDLAGECARYDAILDCHPIDIQILGIGRNGHIGFNEPNDTLRGRTHVVDLAPNTLEANARYFDDTHPIPTQAITMGIESILRAREIVLMAFGRDKAQAVHRALSGEISTQNPASFLQMHPNTTFVLDEGAASSIGGIAAGKVSSV